MRTVTKDLSLMSIKRGHVRVFLPFLETLSAPTPAPTPVPTPVPTHGTVPSPQPEPMEQAEDEASLKKGNQPNLVANSAEAAEVAEAAEAAESLQDSTTEVRAQSAITPAERIQSVGNGNRRGDDGDADAHTQSVEAAAAVTVTQKLEELVHRVEVRTL